jgi:PDZ domain
VKLIRHLGWWPVERGEETLRQLVGSPERSNANALRRSEGQLVPLAKPERFSLLSHFDELQESLQTVLLVFLQQPVRYQQDDLGSRRRQPGDIDPAAATALGTRPFLGVGGFDPDKEAAERARLNVVAGVPVKSVLESSSAAAMGLRVDDGLLTFDDYKLSNWSRVLQFLSAKKPGDKIRVEYEREGTLYRTEGILGLIQVSIPKEQAASDAP